MPDPGLPAEHAPQASTGSTSLTGYFKYGWSLIRREGLGYFIKRSYQLVSWKISEFFRSFRIGRGKPAQEHFLVIADLDPADVHLHSSTPQTESTQVAPADLAQAPAWRDQLIQLARTNHAQHLPERETLIQEGYQLFSGRKLLFVSPIRVLGGGAHLIFLAARAMRQMGVDTQLLNVNVHRGWFETHYPQPGIPVFFTDVEQIPQAARGFDAVIATSNPTVSWIAPLADQQPVPSIGYYIQDYEPYFYAQGSHEYHKAVDSYSLIPNSTRMVTTPWITEQIQRHHSLDSEVVGGHMDTDLFQPVPYNEPAWPERPLRITAMIRPTTPRRNAHLTMAVLRQVSQRYPTKVEFRLFGCELSEPGFASLEQEFPWKLAGQLRSTQVASLFNQADIFVDFSEFQAFGLTSLEAMAMGLAVIVPSNGGTGVYARDGENCLVVDGCDQQACVETLTHLVEDDSLRSKLQTNAISTAARFYPELPALNMLKALFKDRP